MMRRCAVVVAAALASALALVTHAAPARACGVSGSGAPGLCDASAAIDEKRVATSDRYGASYGFTSSVLYFSDGFRAPTERHVAMLSYEHPLPKLWTGHWTLGVNAGVLLGGALADATFRPGVIAAVSLSHLIVAPRGYASPFLLSSFTLAGMYAQTVVANDPTLTDYTAFDFSFEMTTGVALRVRVRTANATITPFLTGRLFGGPVFWSHESATVLGTDAYKYALGPGLGLALFHSRLVFTALGSVFGEKSLRLGVSVSF